MFSKIFVLIFFLISSSLFAGGFEVFNPKYDAKEFPECFKDYQALAMTSSNKIFMGSKPRGWSCRNPDEFKSLILLNEDGTIDFEFKYDHATPQNVGSEINSWTVTALWALKSGQYLQRSTTGSDGDHSKRYYLSRIDATGKTDPKFGVNGFFSFDKILKGRATITTAYENSDETIYGIVIQNETNESSLSFPSYIFHLTKDGKLDPKFGNGGLVRFNDDQGISHIRVVNRKLVIVHQSDSIVFSDHTFRDQYFMIYKYELNGTLMPGYNRITGKELKGFGGWAGNYCAANAFLNSDFIYIAGSCMRDENLGIVVTRYNFDGELDQGYGGNQKQVFLPLPSREPLQETYFVNFTGLKNGEVAISAGIKKSYINHVFFNSVLTFHLTSSGDIGNWGSNEFQAQPNSWFNSPWSSVDSKGRVMLRFGYGDDYWVRTTPMK